MRRLRIVALATGGLTLAGFASACSLVFSLDGFDEATGGGSTSSSSAVISSSVGLPPSDGGDEKEASPCDGRPDDTPCGMAKDACHTIPVCIAGICTDTEQPDGTMCSAAPDACHAAGTCAMGVCVDGAALPDGTTCAAAKDGCHDVDTCVMGACTPGATFPESHNWDPNNTLARCCGGSPVLTNTNENCNVCGVKCNTGKGQNCEAQGANPTVYQCAHCAANSECWSGCCTISLVPNVCADSDCSGNCPSPSICPAGSTCQKYLPADGKNNVCTY